VAACLRVRRLPLCCRDINANERRSHAVNDSRPSNDEYENGMKAAGSVMKATGSVMKVGMYLSASYINGRVVANRTLLLNVSRGGSAWAQTALDEFFCIAEAGPCAGVTKQEAHGQTYLIYDCKINQLTNKIDRHATFRDERD